MKGSPPFEKEKKNPLEKSIDGDKAARRNPTARYLVMCEAGLLAGLTDDGIGLGLTCGGAIPSPRLDEHGPIKLAVPSFLSVHHQEWDSRDPDFH